MTDIYELAQRIIDIDHYGALDADETAETISSAMSDQPLAVIAWLVEIIEELQA